MGLHSCDICIIGAGMAGLACASRLAEAGLQVILLDKGRGPGGRMSTRRVEIDGKVVSFDHGAQYFTARDPEFRSAVRSWVNLGTAAPWNAAGESAFIGTPGMNGPVRAMAQDQKVLWDTRAERIMRNNRRWIIEARDTAIEASAVAVCVPAEQAEELLRDPAPQLADVASQARSEPCWAVMAGFATRLDIDEDAIRSHAEPISWAARNSAKPARSGEECWVIHASHERSRELIDMPKEQVAPMLLDDFFEQTGTQSVAPVHLTAHRWLYSMAEAVDGEPARFDPDNAIGIAGDYLHSPRVEGAWLSGTALAEKVLAPSNR